MTERTPEIRWARAIALGLAFSSLTIALRPVQLELSAWARAEAVARPDETEVRSGGIVNGLPCTLVIEGRSVLAAMRVGRRCVPYLVRALPEADLLARKKIVYCLGEIADPASVPHLRLLASDARVDAELRDMACDALFKITADYSWYRFCSMRVPAKGTPLSSNVKWVVVQGPQ